MSYIVSAYWLVGFLLGCFMFDFFEIDILVIADPRFQQVYK